MRQGRFQQDSCCQSKDKYTRRQLFLNTRISLLTNLHDLLHYGKRAASK